MTEKNRPICPCCLVKHVAISNYNRGKVYYRNRCDQCYRLNKKPAPPGWVRSGYIKKSKCEKCGCKLKFVEQCAVYYIDGNTKNNSWSNLRTICLNCEIDIKHSILPWKPSNLSPDL